MTQEIYILSKGTKTILVNINEYTPEGIELTPLRIFRGRDSGGCIQRILPDPAFDGMNQWAREHGLPPPNFCTTEEIRHRKIALTKSDSRIDERPSDPGTLHAIMLHCLKTRETLEKIKYTNLLNFQTHYTKEEYEKRNEWITTLKTTTEHPDFTCGTKNPNDVLDTEILANERARHLAHAWCKQHIQDADMLKTTKKILDRDLKTRAVSLTLLQECINKKEPWDKIVELAKPPMELTALLAPQTPWKNLSAAQRHLFEQALTSV
jgi:hypothetical protein